MVSLEAKAEYWKLLRTTPFVRFFIDFLDERPTPMLSALDPADNEGVVQHLLVCVRCNDQATAVALYKKLSTRSPRPETEWIHNDYLVFALVCAVRKFQLDDSWLRRIVHLRPRDEECNGLINKTFENILAGNYNAREDYHQISEVFQLVTGQSQPDGERSNKMVSYLWRHSFPWFDSDFLIIISMRAIRAAFEAKGLLNPEQSFAAEKFTERFISRVSSISNGFSWLVFGMAVGGMASLALFYAEDPRGKMVLGTLAVFGLGLGTLTDLRKKLSAWAEQLLKRLLGYRFVQSLPKAASNPEESAGG